MRAIFAERGGSERRLQKHSSLGGVHGNPFGKQLDYPVCVPVASRLYHQINWIMGAAASQPRADEAEHKKGCKTKLFGLHSPHTFPTFHWVVRVDVLPFLPMTMLFGLSAEPGWHFRSIVEVKRSC